MKLFLSLSLEEVKIPDGLASLCGNPWVRRGERGSRPVLSGIAPPSPRPIQTFFLKQGIKKKGASQDTAKKCQGQDECQKNQKEGGAKKP
jgi:hypothetical protein